MSGHEDITQCSSCRRLIFFCKLKRTGSYIPLEPECLPVLHPGLVAYNENTRGGLVLRKADVTPDGDGIMPVETWMAKWPITIHRSHFADARCPAVQARRKKGAGNAANPETA